MTTTCIPRLPWGPLGSMMHIHFSFLLLTIAALACLPHQVSGEGIPMFINTGGGNFTDNCGNEWIADSATGYYNTGEASTSSQTVTGTCKDELFQTERYDPPTGSDMRYEIPLPEGKYDLYLHFAESYKKAQAPGKRVFNVWVEGSLAFENLDVFSEAKGGYNPLTKKHTVEVKDGDLTIEFGRVIQNPTIKGIEIHSFIQLATAPEFSTMLPRSHLPDLESFKPIYINAGGSNYTDKDGNLWVADSVTKYYNTGFALEKNDSAISGTDDQVLYQSERWDVFNGPSMTYNIPVPAGGVYDLYLHFAEIFSKAQQPKKRVFDVIVEDELVLENFDIFQEVGGYTALTKEVRGLTVLDGMLTIGFLHRIKDPKISAIEIQLAAPSSAPSMMPSTSSQPSAPTRSPMPSSYPSMAPSMFPTETLLPWIDKDENEEYTARHECSFVQAGNRFYLFGGRENPQRLEIYDYTLDKWTQGAQVPMPFNHFQAVEYEGLIWVIGAFQSNNFPDEKAQKNVYVYDPANDVWSKGPKIPRPRGSSGLAVYKDKFYLVGGNMMGHDGGFITWFDEYDPQTKRWRRLTDAANARDHFHAAVLNDKLYLIGGRRTIRGNTLGDTEKKVEVFDFATETWLKSNLPKDLPFPRASAPVAVFDNKIMLIGGETIRNTVAHTRVDALDPTTGRWTTLTPLKHRRHGTQAIVSGEGVYVAGGSPNRGGGNQKKMEVYNTDAPEGKPSRPGIIGSYSPRPGTVTLQHIFRGIDNAGWSLCLRLQIKKQRSSKRGLLI